jgi:hypothetical protein
LNASDVFIIVPSLFLIIYCVLIISKNLLFIGEIVLCRTCFFFSFSV